MKKHSRNCLWMAALLAFKGVCPDVVQARVWLKPKNSAAAPLRIKALRAEVLIEKQFATTRNVMTFQNETSERIEADFFYTVPDDSVVTYFAYWYLNEKVVARVVEKERAAAIYKHITTRMRDPALVEMIGKNTFRARIFPVEPNADLRIEMHFAQVLKSEAKGAVYNFPLEPEEAGKGTLEKLDVRVQVGRDGNLSGVWNNYKLPIKSSAKTFSMQLSQRNYRAPRDLQIHLQRPAASLRAGLFAAPSGGRDGFFALAITPNRDVAQPQLQIRGVRVFDVTPGKLGRLKAGQSTLITGRYRGSGLATVSLVGTSLKLQVSFGSARRNNNVATKLWASRRIEMLSANARNRKAVMQLSQRYTLPSKWTSWLAVPKAEMERFNDEKIEAELEIIGRRYAMEIANGRMDKARALKKQWTKMAAESANEYDGGNINLELKTVWGDLRAALREQSYAEKPNVRLQSTLKNQMKRLERILGPNGDMLQEYIISGDAEVSSRVYVDAVLKSGPNSRLAQRAKRDLIELVRRSDDDSFYAWNSLVKQTLDERGARMAEMLVDEQIGDRPNPQRLARLQKSLNELNKVRPGAAQKYVDNARNNLVWPKVTELAELHVSATYNTTPDKVAAVQARRELDRLAKASGIPAKEIESRLNDARIGWAQSAAQKIALELVEAKYAANPDAARVAQLQREVERLEKIGDFESDRVAYEAQWRLNQMQLNLWGEYSVELQKDKPNRAKLKLLETRMTRIYRDPKYRRNVPEGVFPTPVEEPLKLPKIEELKTELAELDAQKPGANGERLAQLQTQRKEVVDKLQYATQYHLRLGDPLISIDAPKDSQRVVAVLPGGETKTLKWNATSKKWEARFDIPSYASEGSYTITVIIVDKAGARRSMDIRYQVDMTAPHGDGRAQAVQSTLKSTPRKLRLELAGSAGTTRVWALLPWGDKIEMGPSAANEQNFFAIVNVPRGKTAAGAVTYILTDKAHNRTQISVDVSK